MSRELIVKQLFEHFYNKVYKGSSFVVDLDKQQARKLISNFLALLYKQVVPEAVGINLLIDYYTFAFEQYVGKNLKRNISLNWIIGKKMVTRWFDRQDSWRYYSDNFLREYQINTDELRSLLIEQHQPESSSLQIFQSEELEKKRYPDAHGRLFNCATYTTMFNHRSAICTRCGQRDACKQTLSKLNPKLYSNRGYAKTA